MNLFKKILLAPVKGVVAVAKLPVKGVNAAADATIDSLVKKTLVSVARHGLTSLGSVLVSHGYITGNQTSDLMGAGMVLVGLLWSFLEKKYFHADPTADATTGDKDNAQ